jgi:DNA-binding transcriptional regulator GbsR (MarR family)
VTARRSDTERATPDWRSAFVEEMGVLALELGVPRAMVRVLGWMAVCDPPEQSAKEIQSGLMLSAGAVSSATRTLIRTGMLERVAHRGDRRIHYRLRPGSWEGALEARLRTLSQLRLVADRAIRSAGDDADERLQDMRDVYEWFEDQLDELLAKRRSRR